MSWFFFIYIDWFFFFFKQKTAYEMRISDWSSDVCSSDLGCEFRPFEWLCCPQNTLRRIFYSSRRRKNYAAPGIGGVFYESRPKSSSGLVLLGDGCRDYIGSRADFRHHGRSRSLTGMFLLDDRSEEPPSELQSLMRI